MEVIDLEAVMVVQSLVITSQLNLDLLPKHFFGHSFTNINDAKALSSLLIWTNPPVHYRLELD